MAATEEDSDRLVHELLIRFCAAFTDQGFARWHLPDRELGFYRSFVNLYRRAGGPPDRWEQGLSEELERLEQSGMDPADVVLESLDLLGVAESKRDDFIAATVLALRGWAGMLWHMEVRSDRVPLPVLPGTLLKFLAVRLVVERMALAYVAEQALGYYGPLSGLSEIAATKISPRAAGIEQRAFMVFQLAQMLGWYPPALYHLTQGQWSQLIGEIEAFSGLERRRMFHLAFERRFRTQALDALSAFASEAGYSGRVAAVSSGVLHRRPRRIVPPPSGRAGPRRRRRSARPVFSACRSIIAARPMPISRRLCPIVIKPQHWVVEDVVYTLDETHRRRAKTRRALGTASHQVHVGSRNIASGALLTAGLGRAGVRFRWWPGCCFRG